MTTTFHWYIRTSKSQIVDSKFHMISLISKHFGIWKYFSYFLRIRILCHTVLTLTFFGLLDNNDKLITFPTFVIDLLEIEWKVSYLIKKPFHTTWNSSGIAEWHSLILQNRSIFQVDCIKHSIILFFIHSILWKAHNNKVPPTNEMKKRKKSKQIGIMYDKTYFISQCCFFKSTDFQHHKNT